MALTRKVTARHIGVFYRIHCSCIKHESSALYGLVKNNTPANKAEHCHPINDNVITKQSCMASMYPFPVDRTDYKNHSSMKLPDNNSSRFTATFYCDSLYSHTSKTFHRSYHSGQCCRIASSEMPSCNFKGRHLCDSIIYDIGTRKYSTDSGNNSDSEEVKLYLSAVAQPSEEHSIHTEIIPGKGPPPEPPIDCCMSGCANCVWIQYAEELKHYFTAEDGLMKAKEAIETIDNPGLKMFLKFELGLL